jgi:hypothetical protein
MISGIGVLYFLRVILFLVTFAILMVFGSQIYLIIENTRYHSINVFEIALNSIHLIRGDGASFIIGTLKNIYYYSPVSFLIITLVSFFISLIIFVANSDWLLGPSSSEIIRGPKLLSPRQLQREFRKLARLEAKEIYKDLPFVERLSFSKRSFYKNLIGKSFNCSTRKQNVRVPQFIIDRHQAFLGSTGVGKTTLIKHYIEHINQLGEKAIILDLNGEFYSEMGRSQDIILSPRDLRSHRWDFDHELSNFKTVNSSEYAKFLIPKGSETNSFWWKGARTVFSDMLDRYPSASKLWQALSDGERGFRDQLSGLSLNILGKAGSNQDAGILGTLSSDLRFLEDITHLNRTVEKEYFSIASWTQNNDARNIFLMFSDTDFQALSPVVRTWLNLAISGRFESGKDNALIKMNIIVDELGSLGRLEELPNALARLRKYGGKVLIGMQSEGQLEGIYGKEDAKAMKANLGSRYIFRVPEEKEAKALSNYLGRSEVIKVNRGLNKDRTGRLSYSKNESTNYRELVLDSEINKLPDGHYYLKALSLGPCKLRIRKKKWNSINSLHQKNLIFKALASTDRPSKIEESSGKGIEITQDIGTESQIEFGGY